MANKPLSGLADTVSDWWNAKPQAPVPYTVNGVPVVNQPADRRTLQRNAPAPYLSGSEAIANLVKNAHPLDFARDLAKGTYAAGKAAVTNPMGAIEGVVGAGNAMDQIYAARKAEQTGKWDKPKKGSVYSLMSPSQLAKWRQEATANYRKVASYYSYVNKDGDRVTDTAALMRNVTQRPMEVLSLLTPAVEATGARLAQIPSLKTVGNIVQTAGKVGNIVTNPAPYAIAKTVKAVSPVVSAGLRAAGVKPTVFTQAGEYTPKMQQAFRDAKVDPALFDSPEMRKVIQDIINEKGISPAAIREAVVTSIPGAKASRSMATGEVPLTDEERGFRSQANQALAQNMQDNVEAAYRQATNHRGVFTNTSDFSSGVRKAVENELAAMGTSIDDVMKNSRFEETNKALKGSKGFPGAFDLLDEYAGVKRAAPSAAPKPLTVDFGGKHTFDYDKGYWVDPNNNRVTKPRVIDALDNISNRKNIPPPAAPAAPPQGPNRLTGQNVDSVRRNVKDRYRFAKADDALALGAINRGIDNYIIQNAPNFTGDGVAMAQDWANARKTSQLGRQYGNVPPVDPFAPPKPPVAYDPSAVGRTEAARAIVQGAPDLKSTAPPSAFNRVMGYLPSVGTGQVLGYNLGAATGVPGAGFVVGSLAGAGTKAIRNKLGDVSAGRLAKSEAAGAPRVPLFNAPDVRAPVSVAGGIATTAQRDRETPAAPAPPAAPTPMATPIDPNKIIMPEIKQEDARDATTQTKPLVPEKYDLSGFNSNQGELKPEVYDLSQFDSPQRMYGGRTAYRAGGKVGGIEHLVQALMTKAKVAKKASDKATEPLLNERDDAIANALAVAQKAI